MADVAITATARAYPLLPYQKMKDDILGSEYRLSLVFIGASRAQSLNKQYRNKDYTPNVLSFPLTPTDGEIFITPAIAKKECGKFNLSYKGYIGFLYIHSLLHLTGLDHGTAMETAEASYLHKYKLR